MVDTRPPIGHALTVFGLPATVTLPGEEPVATTAIWLPPVSVLTEGVMVSTDRALAVLALPRADVPAVPRGTVIEVAETEGGDLKLWTVESVLGALVDEIRVSVIQTEV